jgi:hypothetical protein
VFVLHLNITNLNGLPVTLTMSGTLAVHRVECFFQGPRDATAADHLPRSFQLSDFDTARVRVEIASGEEVFI